MTTYDYTFNYNITSRYNLKRKMKFKDTQIGNELLAQSARRSIQLPFATISLIDLQMR